jgi:hypothetical protein
LRVIGRVFLARPRQIIGFLSSSLMIAAGLGYRDYRDYRTLNRLYFVVDMETSAPGVTQVFFDVGRGYNERDSHVLQIERGHFHRYTFPLASEAIKSIRFDPINVSAVVRLREARVASKHGDIIKAFRFSDFRAARQINAIDSSAGTLIIHTVANATDPILEIANSAVPNQVDWRGYGAHYRWILAGYAAGSLLFLVGLRYLVIVARRRQYAMRGVRAVRVYVGANPRRSLLLTGLVAAVVSCYPVVFFGKSFVSPVGVAALYASPPYVPGFPLDVVGEDFRGSDVAATAWCFAPNTVVQHEALIRYFEFPFWNRYVGGGVPLLAQGQSMIGDVLHWIPIAFGQSAVGWDLKFVLSKAVFAVGMGLLVFRLTGNSLASSLIAVSSCFLDFFAYRVNHPAFFVLTYAPWIVLQWDRLGEILARPRPGIGRCVIQVLLLAGVTWLQLNAGSPKEGVVTGCFMHALGLLAFAEHVRHRRGWIRSMLIGGGFGVSLVMVTAPHWLLFLDLLRKSITQYDNPEVHTFPVWQIVGFFDSFFFWQNDGGLHAIPSTNVFVLLGASSAIASLRWNRSLKLYGVWLLFGLAMAVAYGVIPVSVLISIPFLNRIQTQWNSFSMPMLILALILAGYGIHGYLTGAPAQQRRRLVLALSVFPALWLVYAVMTHSGRTVWFALAIWLVIIIALIQLYRQAASGPWSRQRVIILACCLFLFHVRHGMHLMTGIKALDALILNPGERADFARQSSAVEYVKRRIRSQMTPSRVIGEGLVMFPGYNTRLGVEGVIPVESLRSGHFDRLLSLIDYPVMAWACAGVPACWLRLINSDQIPSRAAGLDLLGVGYVVATPGTRAPEGVTLIHSSDLDVWERPTVWPRAFFVNQVVSVDRPTDIVNALGEVGRGPFAAVESQFIPQGIPRGISGEAQVIPGREYALTNNSTRFSVDATGPGLIVLGETYYPDDFIASVNGQRVDYIRVNEAFKGVWVTRAGQYDVSFTYRPARLAQAMIISVCGVVLLLVLAVVLSRRGRISRRA